MEYSPHSYFLCIQARMSTEKILVTRVISHGIAQKRRISSIYKNIFYHFSNENFGSGRLEILLLIVSNRSFYFFPSERNKILWIALTVRKHDKNPWVCFVVHHGVKKNLRSQRIPWGRYNQLGVSMTISPDQDPGKVHKPTATSTLRSVFH